MNCGACKEIDISENHDCIESKYLLEIRHWLFDGLEDTGHDLGHYFTSAHRHSTKIRKYAVGVTNDMESIERAKLHLDVCDIIGANHNTFKPFESELIVNLPSEDESLKILWDAIREHLWTYTQTYRIYKKTYSEAVALRERYFGKNMIR